MAAGSPAGEVLHLSAGEGDQRSRVDAFIAEHSDELSRSQVRRLIDAGEVRVNGERVRPSHRLEVGDRIEVRVPPPTPVELVAEDIPLHILHEDTHLIVIDKPAGMVVHPAPGHESGTLVNALLAHCGDLSGIGGELRPGIVHRIDKDTSGILVVTKSDAAHQGLSLQFRDKALQREYLAVVAPAPERDRGTFETLYGRHPVHRKKFSSRVERGKRAVTHYQMEERFAGAALIRCTLDTGRTHQIRVHLADAGSPLVGDPLYGRRRKGEIGALAAALGRQALHAARLAFRHPCSGEELDFRSPLPDDMVALIDALRSIR